MKELIDNGKAVLGIELGSTRIKAVLTGKDNAPIAQGASEWENKLENGLWTYSMEDVDAGLKECFENLAADVKTRYGTEIKTLKAIGISAMMHGYLAFDKDMKLLVPFRTWRNTITGTAANELTKRFSYNIPQRWSISHLYQAILNNESHVKDICFITTLAGYVHYLLTGQKVLGVGDASGMFPIDPEICDYNQGMLDSFDELIKDRNFPWKIRDILPKVLSAGEDAGTLTEDGAKYLDPQGKLQAGILLCPPEGDAGTGMAATNSVRERTGNVSAGTSVFSMVVLEKPMNGVHREIDVVTTPTGSEVAMVHCNNCTSDLNAWVNIFDEYSKLMGNPVNKNDIYTKLYTYAMQGASDCGGVISYNFLSGEPVAGTNEGRPMVVRMPDAEFSLANFMRANLYSSLASLKLGNDILSREEDVQVDRIMGHGGLFKTKGAGQNVLADALKAPVTCMTTAGEGGAWGIALLAAYRACVNEGEKAGLADWLDEAVFKNAEGETVQPDAKGSVGFDRFMDSYKKGLAAEKAAVENLQSS
ncbi:MAG: FGGY-family carbohydrate kinase [Lachnospiraceae bacterium]|nr:FGGY-family carbohydrate kinase [Lachnospiraceae bacterium]